MTPERLSPEHVSEDVLIDIAEGRVDAEALAHVRGCASCARALADTREMLDVALDADVPEPAPMYWEAFRTQVRRRIEAERRRSPWALGWPALLAAAALLAVAVARPWTPRTPPSSAAATASLPAWSALPPAEDDPGLFVIEQLTRDMGDQAQDVACESWAACVVDMSDDEVKVLGEWVKENIGGRT